MGELKQKSLVCVLTETSAQSALVEVTENSQPRVLRGSLGHGFTKESEAVLAVDESLQELGAESESVNEVVFGLEAGWVEAGGIRDVRKPLLKNVTQKLGLKATGFVLLNEAWIESQREISPLGSSLLLYVSDANWLVQLVEKGDGPEAVQVGRSADAVADLREVLARLTSAPSEEGAARVWPTSVYLASFELSENQLEVLQQELLSLAWTEVGWRHQPVIEIVSLSELLRITALQAGRAVRSRLAESEQAVAPDPGDSEWKSVTQASSFGVPVEVPETQEELAVSTKHHESHHSPPFKSANHWLHAHKKGALIGFIAGLLGLLVVGGGALAVGSSAQITLELETKPLSAELQVKVDPSLTTSNPESQVLAGQLTTERRKGSKAMPSTGVKLVGEKAAGVVVVLNKTLSSKSFPAGTILTSGTQKFTLTKEVQVASASVSNQSATSQTLNFGKAEVEAQATEIGDAFNLKKDATLKIADAAETSFAAVVKDGLAGGTSREVRVVSQKDSDGALKNLTTQLLTDLNDELKKNSVDGRYLVPTGESKVVRAVYTSKVGEESESVEVEAELDFSVISYAADDLEPLAKAVLTKQLSVAHTLQEDSLQILSSPQAASAPTNAPLNASASATVKPAKTLTLDLNVSGMSVPQLDLPQITTRVLGQTAAAAEKELATLTGVKQAQITFSPSVAKWWGRLPSAANRLEIRTKP